MARHSPSIHRGPRIGPPRRTGLAALVVLLALLAPGVPHSAANPNASSPTSAGQTSDASAETPAAPPANLAAAPTNPAAWASAIPASELDGSPAPVLGSAGAGPEDARRRLDRLLDRGPARVEAPEDRARLHLELGHRLRQESRRERALDHFLLASRLHPELGEAHLAAATLAGQLGRFRQSARAFAWLMDLDPTDPRARLGRALALQKLGHHAQSRQTLEAALGRWPDDPPTADALARLLAASPDPRVRDGARAVELAQRAVREGRQATYAETLAMALAETGRHADAAALVTTLIERAGASSPAFVDGLREQLALYEARRPYRLEAPGR